MEALSRIPKVLETLDDMRSAYNVEEVFANYKKNVKIFIESMKNEVAALINQYQTTIASLRQEIAFLRTSNNPNSFVRTPQVSKYGSISSSPSKGKVNDLMQTANSNTFTPFKISKMEQLPISTILKKKKSIQESHFPSEFISPQESMWEHNQSKFEVASRKRKQRQEQLRHFLQSGRKNLNLTTNQFLEVIGRNQFLPQEQENVENAEEDKSFNKRQESLNKSLGQICQSLDTSYVSKRARSQKKKKEAKVMQQKKKKEQVQEQTAKMLKDRGIKNLLQRLRDNVQNSAQGPPQPISTSKLISCNSKSKQPAEILSPGKSKSKVMINPVPVDIGRRSQVISRSRETSPSPQRKPQSILKRSSTILSRSISAFSANDITI